MKLILFILIVFVFCTSSSPVKDCKCKGIFLGGRVNFIRDSSKADFKIREARASEDWDIAVSFMNNPTKECGEWYEAEDSVDFSVCYVESNEDFTIGIFPDPNAVVPWEELEINRARTSTSLPGSSTSSHQQVSNSPSQESAQPASTAQSGSNNEGFSSSSCSCKGIPLYGKVQVVEAFADFDVQVVTAFPDLKVQTVDAFPDQCGKWQFVTSFPDFKIRIVNAFPDFKIQYVNAFPGTN